MKFTHTSVTHTSVQIANTGVIVYLTWAVLAGGTIRNSSGTFIKVLENDLITLDNQLFDTALKKDQNSVKEGNLYESYN